MLEFMLYLSIFLEYARPGYVFPLIDTIKLGTILPLSTFLFILFAQRNNNFGEVFSHYNTKWLLFFFFLIILSILTADIKKLTTTAFNTELGYFFLFLIIVRLVDTIEKLKKLVVSLIFAHLFLLYNNPQLITEPETRSYVSGGTFLGDGNDFSLSVVILVPLALFLILDSKSPLKKYFFVFIMLLLLLAVIGTQSRGASLALIASAVYIWWRSKAKIWGVVVAFVLLIGVFIYAPPQYFDRMNTLSNYESEGSAMGRIMAWKSGVRMALASPLTGQGIGHYSLKLGTEFRPPEYGDQNLPWLTAHSCYFLVLGELGFPGLIYFVGILFMNYRRNDNFYRKSIDKEDDIDKRYNLLFLCAASSIISFAVGGAFLSAAYYPHVFILAGICTAIQFMYKREKEALLDSQKKLEVIQSEK